MKLYDTHAHLQDSVFDDDREEVIIRAKGALSGVVIPSYDIPSSKRALSFSEDTFFKITIGIHPHYASDNKDLSSLEDLIDYADGIGEIGLDYYRNISSPEDQKEVFYNQLLIAKQHNKFIIIHEREAFQDLWDIIQGIKPEQPVIFHCFSHDEEEIEKILKVENYIPAFCGNITYKKAENLRRAFKLAFDARKFFLETDSPWLSPIPLRGKRNEPRNVFYIYEYTSHLLNVKMETISHITSQWWDFIFGGDNGARKKNI